ncbi:MAG: hypothetical protein IT479_06275 [Xanthomonadales bacterium]|nr:hypothetical protein [Xanthomonadales bacterium]MCC6592866.1 hypothetical protein [Xanthomonadales bacterium]MCE7931170.1 hypothetical protein [Xanthomonadales bacterium PRO6]
MNAIPFWRGVLLALLLSIVGAVLHAVAAPWIGSALSLRLSLLLVATLYVFALLASAPGRSGRVLAALAWCVLAGALLLAWPRLSVWLLAATLWFWLLRSLLRYQSLLPATFDALLGGFALAAAVATAMHTHSLFLALWCYFLVQAFNSWLPHSAAVAAVSAPAHDFDTAFRNAEAALRRLSLHS